MRELNVNEIEQVNGGAILAAAGAVIAIASGLIGVYQGAKAIGKWMAS